MGIDVVKDYCGGFDLFDADGIVGCVDDDDSGCGDGRDGD